MGVVWLARDEVFGRDVAIKEVLLPPQLQEKEREAVFQRTRREARVAARLSHPNVVKVYDVIEYDSRPWIVMELVRARSLTEVVEESGPLAPQRAAAIGLQVLSALTAAHAAGITHRDVKPGNVLCADNGRVVLTDFGIASVADDPSVTMHGVLMGSPAYIAPERVRGGPARAASDLWSLAATLYAAVEGRPPYDRGAAVPTVTAVVNEDPDPLQRAGVLGPVLEQIFVKDPDARPDADTIRTLLREVASTPESETEVVATVALKREATTSPPATVPTASATAPATKATTTKVSDPAVPTQRRRAPLVVAAFLVGCLLIGGTALQNMASQADEDKRGQGRHRRHHAVPHPLVRRTEPVRAGQPVDVADRRAVLRSRRRGRQHDPGAHPAAPESDAHAAEAHADVAEAGTDEVTDQASADNTSSQLGSHAEPGPDADRVAASGRRQPECVPAGGSHRASRSCRTGRSARRNLILRATREQVAHNHHDP